MRPLLALVIIAFLAAPGVAHAGRLVEIATPSRFVDPADVSFNGADHPRELRARVLLPDGYDASEARRYPVLFLLHGVGDRWDTWSGASGRVQEIARDLEAIVVMPEAARGFFTDWFNGGRRGAPGWESFYLEELVPLVERRFRVRPGRRWHAVAGLSMGGMGATFLGARLPGWFGSVATFSGFVDHQRPEIPAGLQAYAGVDYEQIFGPVDGAYATGHNPARLTDNLRWTRVFATVGDGTADPAAGSGPAAVLGGGVAEVELRLQNDAFADAARESGVPIDYRPRPGVHDWPYWRADLAAALRWDFFAPVQEAPRRWTYRTIARRGEMWGLRFAFAEPPEQLATFARDGDRLRGTGAGRVTLSTGRGCTATAALPFDVAVPERCPLRVTVRPRRVRRLVRTRLRFRVRDDHGRPVAAATVKLDRKRARTDDRGRATIVARLDGRPGLRRPSAIAGTPPNHRTGRARLRVRRHGGGRRG